MNCLSCSKCSLTPQTDFTKRGTVICCAAPLCGQPVGPRPVNLQGCAQFERAQEKQWTAWTPVADAFLSAAYKGTTPFDSIARTLGRSSHSTRHRVQRLGLTSPKSPRAQTSRVRNGENRRGKYGDWTAAQVAFLRRVFQTEAWPQVGGQDKVRARNRELKRAIESELARLGPPRTWKGIHLKVRVCIAFGHERAYKRCLAKNAAQARRSYQAKKEQVL